MDSGSDATYYLHQAYRVLAIEADSLEGAIATRCARVSSRRLTTLNVGIAAAGSAIFGSSTTKAFGTCLTGKSHPAIGTPIMR